jgi:hypothetical protein
MANVMTNVVRRPKDVIVVAVLLIVFGLGEIWVGMFGNFLGILSQSIPPSAATAIVCAFYSLGGVALLVTRRQWGTILSLIFIGAEVLGRAYLVATGVAPSHGADFYKIVVGAIIAIGFMSYIALRSFSKSAASARSPRP